MKEKYVKPAMVIERFTLTSSIAKNCSDLIPDGSTNQSDAISCTWDIGGGLTLFLDSVRCLWPVENDGIDMGFGIMCYNNPGEGAYIFSS